MIALGLAQVRSRWGQAVTLLLLSMAAVLAVASGPVYLASVERAVIAQQVAAAAPAERLVVYPTIERDISQTPRLSPAEEASGRLTDFVPVTTVETGVQGLAAAPDRRDDQHRLVARDGFCAQVTFGSGRCPVANREAALPAGLAAETGREVGDVVEVTAVVDSQPEFTLQLLIVGVFSPRDARDPYWGHHLDLVNSTVPEAAFTTRNTLLRLGPGKEYVHHHAYLPADRLTPDGMGRIRAEVREAREAMVTLESAAVVTTGSGVPQLLDRISREIAQARAVLLVGTVPAVLLCWFVLYFAVRQGIAARRPEVGAIALRGTPRLVRAVLTATEPLLPVLLAIPLGLLAAHLLIRIWGPAGGGVPVAPEQWLATGIAGLGSVVAVLLAIRRELAAPVTELLRRSAPRRRLAVAAVEVLVVAVAIVVAVQLRTFEGTTTGVLAAAPAVVLVAAVALVTRLIRPALDRLGRVALRRGALATALAAIHLARRPGSAQLVLVIGLALGMLGFAAVAADFAAQGRTAVAEQRLGATRVLAVEQTDRGHLLAAVRAADPTGKHAMAVVTFPGTADLPVLAVDTPRLPAVAVWSESFDAPAPERFVELLRPSAPDPVLIDDGELVADLTLAGEAPRNTVTASVFLATDSREGTEVVNLGRLAPGRSQYRVTVENCPEGCRIAALTVRATQREATRFEVTWHGLSRADTELVPAGWFTQRAGWRTSDSPPATGSLVVSTTGSGMQMQLGSPRIGVEYEAQPVDAPYPLPLVTTVALPAAEWMDNLDGRRQRVTEVARPAGLPGTGAVGAMVDLEYAERNTAIPGPAQAPAVWLAADAPDEIVERLEAEGLVVAEERTIDSLRAGLDVSGTALGVRYYLLAAGLGVIVALGAVVLVAAVDRQTWGRPMRQLRVQGLAGRTTTAGAVWAYVGLVGVGGVAGVLAAAAAWWVAGDRLPLGLGGVVVPAGPRWEVVSAPWLLVLAGFVAMALVAAGWQRQVVRRVREERD